MTASISAATRLIALLGDPVGHSLSPIFQNAAFEEAGVDGVYLALRCVAGDVPALLRAIALAGGGGNVTLPHKEVAAAAVDRTTTAVDRTGACNTFWCEAGVVCGDNTDVAGLSAAVRDLLGRDPRGARVLLIGAGGAARGALAALIGDAVAEVVLVNRTPSRAAALAAAVGSSASRVAASSGFSALRGESFDLVVNATSLGLRPDDPLPMSLDTGVSMAAGLDLVYTRRSTPWVRSLTEQGVRAADGLEMLIHQGAAAFRRWWDVPVPLEAMRLALRQATNGGT